MYDTLESLKEAWRKGEKIDFLYFWEHHTNKNGRITKSCLSQWYLCDFTIEHTTYCCMEQYMMAEKARLFQDEQTLEEILSAHDPKQMKASGRKIKNFETTLWNAQCQQIVRRGNLAKFSQNASLKQFLLSTGDKILVEASPYDTIWGIGLGEGMEAATDPNKWLGTNYLGFALTWVREQIKEKNE